MARLLQIVLLVFGLAVVAAIPFLLGNLVFATTPVDVTPLGSAAPVVNGVQEIRLYASPEGYSPPSFTVKKGVPVKILFGADQYAGCGRQLIIPAFGVSVIANPGQETPVEFTPSQEGVFPYRCSMNMFRGTINVVA